MSFARRHLPWILFFTTFAFLSLRAIFADPFQLGVDEGYELIKAFLCFKGATLYHNFWNDQPPLHTGLLAVLFHLFGPHIHTARSLALAFSLLLYFSLYKLTRRETSSLAAVIGLAVLTAWPGVFQLGVSVMLEVPAMSMGLLALWLMTCYGDRRPSDTSSQAARPVIRPCISTHVRILLNCGRIGLILSGLIYGLALQTKLTSAVFLPALSLQCFLSFRSRCHQRSGGPGNRIYFSFTKQVLLWSGSIIIGIIIVWLFFPYETFHDLFFSHFSKETQSVLGDSYKFNNSLLWNQLEFILPSILSTLFILLTQKWQSLPPVVLLMTVLLIHQLHRPYWSYYDLHFAIPFAWLCAIAAEQLFRIFRRLKVGIKRRNRLLEFGEYALWALAISAILAGLPERWWQTYDQIHAARQTGDDPVLMQILEYKDLTRWIFTDRALYAFYAGIPVPPNLAVIPQKRLWSKQINEDLVLKELMKYAPEQIALFNDYWLKGTIKTYIESHYIRRDHPAENLFLRNDLASSKVRSTEKSQEP